MTAKDQLKVLARSNISKCISWSFLTTFRGVSSGGQVAIQVVMRHGTDRGSDFYCSTKKWEGAIAPPPLLTPLTFLF